MKREKYYLEGSNKLSNGRWYSLGSFTKIEKAEAEMKKEERRTAYEVSIGYADLNQAFRIVKK